MTDRALSLATAPRSNTRHWKQRTVTWAELVEWLDLDHPAGHRESGGYVLGTLAETTVEHTDNGERRECLALHRNAEAVVSRDVLALDADSATAELVRRVRETGWVAVVHTTWSHTAAVPRYRVLILLSRPVAPGEYRLLAREVMAVLGVEQFDAGSAQPERFMFKPATQDPTAYEAHVFDGEPLDVGRVLAEHVDALLEADDGREEPPSRERATNAVPASEVYAERVRADIAWTLGKLDELADLPDGGTVDWPGADAEGKPPGEAGWDYGVYHAAQRLVQAANAGIGYSLEDAERDFKAHAPDSEGTYDRDHKWRRAVDYVGDDPTPYEGAADVFEPVPDDGAGGDPPAKGKRMLPLAVRLRQHVEEHYELFPGLDDGRVFAQPKAGGRAELVSGPFVVRATSESGLGSKAGALSAAATEAAKVLMALATEHEPRELALRVHYRPGRIVLDLAQPGSSRCVVVTAEGWTVEDVPPRDVVFMDPGRPLPTPARDGDVEALRRLLRWRDRDARWLLIKGWLPAALLAGTPRPMLGLFGPQGSAKTTTGRYVTSVLDPKPPSVLGGGFGKSRQDDETKALKSYLPAWDNVAGLSGEGADFLSRLVTGDLIERRQLYTDADMVSIHYRRTGVITGLTVPRGVKSDTLDRLILVPIKPLAEDERLSEGALDAEWERAHPQVLGGVLDLAARMLAGLDGARGANHAGLRMADYAEALWAVDPALYEAYADNVATARHDMASDDPFIQSVAKWVLAGGGYRECTPSAAWRAAEHFRFIASPGDRERSWWPRSARAFSDALASNAELLQAAGITVTDRRSNGQRLKRFTTAEAEEVM